jgi:two-component system sensor kinase FixL
MMDTAIVEPEERQVLPAQSGHPRSIPEQAPSAAPEKDKRGDQLHALHSDLAQLSLSSGISSLATALAHDLNQPLTAITNYIEAAREILKGAPNDMALLDEALGEAIGQSLRAGQIVRRLRDCIPQAASEKSAFGLTEILAEARELARLPGEIELITKLDPKADLVVADRMQLRLVLINIMRNALKALEDAPIKRLEIRSLPVSESLMEIVISDSGPGLSEQAARTVFEPFRSPNEGSLELELAICRTIVEAQGGGRIWVEPSDLGGSSFHFTALRAPRS